jgi:hypothetical protein
MNYSKLTKKELINDINIYYLKKGVYSDNIYKISKCKLIKLIIENDIPHIDNEMLKKEIEETEKFNNFMEIIYYNFIKYKNISYEEIYKIKSNPNITSTELNEFIVKNNLTAKNDINEIKTLAINLHKVYDDYCQKNNIKNMVEFKTLPDIIKSLNSLIEN